MWSPLVHMLSLPLWSKYVNDQILSAIKIEAATIHDVADQVMIMRPLFPAWNFQYVSTSKV